MILSVADKLNFQQHLTSKEYLQFKETVNDSIESLMEKSCNEPESVPYQSYMIVAFAIGKYCQSSDEK
jgi:hypothetical protein